MIEEYVDRAAREVIDTIGPKGEVDFVTECSSRLPLKVICDMMGVPESQYDFVFNSSNTILGLGDPEYTRGHGQPDAAAHGGSDGSHAAGHGDGRGKRRRIRPTI